MVSSADKGITGLERKIRINTEGTERGHRGREESAGEALELTED
jgi:hypothetical protein